MRITLIASILLLASSQAWAAPHRHNDDDPRDVPVVVDREDILNQLSELDAELVTLMKRAKRIRPMAESLRRARAQVQALRERMVTSPTPREWRRSLRNPHRYFEDHPNPGPLPPAPAQPPQPYPPQPYPPQPLPPPPPQRPVVYPIQDAAFQNLLRAIGEQSLARDRLRVLTEASSAHWFLVDQARQVLKLFDFSRDRLGVVRVLNPRILDRDNLYQLYSSFEHSGDKAELQKLLAQPLNP